MKQPLNALIVKEGEGTQDAVPLGDGIFMSRGISNSYLVTTPDGDVLINSGMAHEAPEIIRRFAAVSSNPLRVIVFTQGHADHVGGWSQLDRPGVETIAQANHADVREYWTSLGPYYSSRTERLWRTDLAHIDRSHQPPEPVVTTTSSIATSSRSGVAASSCWRHRAVRPPTRWWSGSPRCARCSPVNMPVRQELFASIQLQK